MRAKYAKWVSSAVSIGCMSLIGFASLRAENPQTTRSMPQTKFSAPPQLNMKPALGDCTGPVEGQPLVQPQEISPNRSTDILETELVVRLRERCVPIWDSTVGWHWQTLNLRTYGFPIDHNKPIEPGNPSDPNIAWSAPGPTYIMKAGSSPDRADGTNFKMVLNNYMPTQPSYSECDPLKDGVKNPHYTSPNCFHGANVTNFHFHGFHVSPQEHQDYVLLSLLPYGANAASHVAAHSRGDTQVGSYRYDVARLRGNQAPGTHWYHAHKHGATALQVLNGLVGTFEIHGKFDDQLDKFFKDRGHYLEDRLMVVQQIQEQLPGLDGPSNARPQYPLINGQANPRVTMKPGEIQRWRFVGATMQASAQLTIGFEELANGDAPDPEVRQIAMDGVQFAPENYECQTLLRGPDCTNEDPARIDDFNLNPGNRIDLLVRAPSRAGTYYMTHKVIGNLKEKQAAMVRERAEALTKDGNSNPPLLTLVVTEDAVLDMRFPTKDQFPKLPSYLADLRVPRGDNTNIHYQMSNQGDPSAVRFEINNKPYDPSCIDESFKLDRAVQWTLTNNSGIAHPFHIHTNPFQLISTTSYNTAGETIKTNYKPPYVWQDTMAIPIASATGTEGRAVIHYEALNFTGEYVNHCHILGHEDRGMMQNVQATCANGKWGKPTFDGSSECEHPVIPPPPTCM